MSADFILKINETMCVKECPLIPLQTCHSLPQRTWSTNLLSRNAHNIITQAEN